MKSFVLLALVSLVNANVIKLSTEDQEYNEVKNSRNFTGKVVLVTGSNSGIGEGIVKLFAQLGAQVVVSGRNKETVKSVAEEVQKLSPNKLKPLEVVFDVTKIGDLSRLLNETIKTFGKLDVLVNNVGFADFNTSIKDKNYLKVFDDSIKTNLRPVLELSQLAVPYLEKTNGTIISTSSVYGKNPHKSALGYGLTKHAIDFTTQTLALELAPKIRVNAVSPGFVATNAWLHPKTPLGAKFASKGRASTPLQRFATIFDVAKGVVFLASTDAQYVTGANLEIDGGLVHNFPGNFPD